MPPAASTAWRAVITADRAYYERMRAAADPGAPDVAFPPYCPERRFVLTGDDVLIGRQSRSRGIEPGIDLTGPPEDAAVSHMHALLVSTADGWNIVDLDSANGTYLNASTEQLAPNQPVALSDGDQIHVGGWTTLTIRR
jgi:pSer/pThr/pTyr-binding forkhead associated (FHA) protein